MSSVWDLAGKIRQRLGNMGLPTGPAATEEVISVYRRQQFTWMHPAECWAMNHEGSFAVEVEPSLDNSGWTAFSYTPGMWSSLNMKKCLYFLQLNSRIQLAYGDEDWFWKKESQIIRMQPNLKPEWSPQTLLSYFYMGNGILLHRDLLARLGYTGVQEKVVCLPMEALYDLVLRAVQFLEEEEILHYPRVLFHRNVESLWEEDALKKLLPAKETLSTNTVEGLLEGILQNPACTFLSVPGAGEDGRKVRKKALEAGIFGGNRHAQLLGDKVKHVKYPVPEDTLVSIVILSKDHPDTLEKCVKSIREKTKNIRFAIAVLDNGSEPAAEKKYRELSEKYDFSYLLNRQEFNFSRGCNEGVVHTDGQLICLLNDDTEVLQEDWLEQMAGYALLPCVGAVGAKLYYAGTNLIQHAGVTNLKVGPSHKLLQLPDDKIYYYGKNVVNANFLAVTGACLVVRRELYRKVGGFKESLRVAYNDIDFCMSLEEMGYRNVQCNSVVLYHAESVSRGKDRESDEKWNRLLEEKEKLYAFHPHFEDRDPYYHPHLMDNDSMYLPGYKNFMQKNTTFALRAISDDDKNRVAGLSERGLEGRFDRYGIQRKIRPNEADTIWLDGWCIALRQDNASYEKHLLLKNGQNFFLVDTASVYRKDVEDSFPEEQHCGLSGFYVRIRRNSLPSGTYKVGIWMEGLLNSRSAVIWFDNTLTV